MALAETHLMVAFERTYRDIFGSQIEALKRLNAGPQIQQDLLPIFDAAVAKAPDFYRDYPFQSWMGFLKMRELVGEHEGVFVLTDAGKDFLRYLLNQGYPETKIG